MKAEIKIDVQGDNFIEFKEALLTAVSRILNGTSCGSHSNNSSSFSYEVKKEQERNDKENFYWEGKH